MKDLKEIASEAARLDEESRASLASQMLRSLPPPDHPIADEEVFQRMREAEEDPGVMIGHEELISGIHGRGS